MKVLHLPSTVGGNPQGLSRHLRELGVDSESWAFEQTYFNYPCDRVIWSPEDSSLLREFKRIAAIFQAARAADVIHFSFGTSLSNPVVPRHVRGTALVQRLKHRLLALYWDLLQLAELHLYRLSGIPLFVHYQGDDARQGDFSRATFKINIASHVEPGYYGDASDHFKRRMIRRMASFCDAIYSVNPDLLHVLPLGSKFVPYCHISLEDWAPVYPESAGSAPLKIGHAPSHRGVKGTERVLKAVDDLRAEGHKFEMVIVEGVSHQSARKLYETIDILVDQLYAGWYGGLAVEAMALGKPVMVYIRHDDLGWIPEEMRSELPFIEVTADTIQDRLRAVVQMPRQELHALGRRSRTFVERWHNPHKIAGEMKAAYEAALFRRRTEP